MREVANWRRNNETYSMTIPTGINIGFRQASETGWSAQSAAMHHWNVGNFVCSSCCSWVAHPYPESGWNSYLRTKIIDWLWERCGCLGCGVRGVCPPTKRKTLRVPAKLSFRINRWKNTKLSSWGPSITHCWHKFSITLSLFVWMSSAKSVIVVVLWDFLYFYHLRLLWWRYQNVFLWIQCYTVNNYW